MRKIEHRFSLHTSSVYLLCLISLISCFSCSNDKKEYFQLLEADETGLNFQNTVTQSTDFSFFDYMYFFNGAGVGAADFNKDGLTDLFFSANQGENKLFLNQGNLQFKDVSQQAKITGNGYWSTGVSIVDINQDGLLDVYVSVVGDHKVLKGSNQLFVCTGINDQNIPVYEDQAIQYDLDLAGFGTQALFADFDNDGDLDMFQLNHSIHQNGTFGRRKDFAGKTDRRAGDKYFENQDGRFTERTDAVGINSSAIGYGLGVVAGDVNNDGWLDIYVGNDFHENDYLYLNQQDGTFKEVLTSQIQHTSRFSMGVDMADVNNNGYSDIFSSDMLPYKSSILKASLSEDDYDIYYFKKKYGYADQLARNNLQLNNQQGNFMEIAQYANVHASDWSWAPILFDFENDGKKDLFVSNGIPRRMNDIDYINFMQNNEDKRVKTDMGYVDEEDLKIIEKMPQIKISNKFFHQSKALKFQEDVGVINDKLSYSNGGIQADFDNDGDLDIVVNNLEDKPFIYKNLTQEKNISGDYLQLKLRGYEGNLQAIGSRVIVMLANNKRISYEYLPVRGFQSSALTNFHIAIGDKSAVEKIYLIWPDQTYQEIPQRLLNKSSSIEYSKGLLPFNYAVLNKSTAAYKAQEIQDSFNVKIKHEENDIIEFNREPLMPHMVSAEGPALAVGDINGDSYDDLFIGSAKREKSKILLQDSLGKFQEMPQPLLDKDKVYEDVDAVFEDMDSDGDLDLIVASGGNEYWGKSEYLLQRIYWNNGTGLYDKKYNFANSHMTASSLVAEDFDGDGLTDVFFGARAVPKNYGMPASSKIFYNNGDQSFKDVTDQYAPFFNEFGLITDATAADINNDGRPDLVLATEWDAIYTVINNKSSFIQQKVDDAKGWWKMVYVTDINKDGIPDILAGNNGENNRLKPTKNQPVRCYINDYDDNGSLEQIITYYNDDDEILLATHKTLMETLPMLKKEFLYAKDFAKASVEDLLGAEALDASLKLEATNFSSTLYVGQKDGSYKPLVLPKEFQFSTINAASELKSEKKSELLLAGNFYKNTIELGLYDAFYGGVLSWNDSTLSYQKVDNLMLDAQIKHIKPLVVAGKFSVAVSQNNDSLKVIQIHYEK